MKQGVSKYHESGGRNDSFSILHTISYTFVALQQLILYHQYPSIYWNTATLTVNSGSTEEDELEEGEEPEEANKNKSTDYGKISTAIGELQHRGVTIALPLINQADFSFRPDEENNRIIFGLKGVQGIGDNVANTIINLRPYESLEDFYNKVTNVDEENSSNVKIGDARIITLIKAGAFDELENKPREEVMRDFIRMSIKPRVQLDMRSIKSVLEFDMIPEDLEKDVRLVNFKDYILRPSSFVKNDEKYKSKKIYVIEGETEFLTEVSLTFFKDNYIMDMEEDKHYWYNSEGQIELYDSDLKKITNDKIKKLRDWLSSEEALETYNQKLHQQQWDKYCEGSLSKWEMDSLSFYYNEHELTNMDRDKYGLVDYNTLPEEPKAIGQYKWRGRMWDEFEIHRIAGTVLDKDKTKHTVSLLTTDGVVTLKMHAGNFAHYDRQVVRTVIEKGKEKKEVVERSWFTRGNLLCIVGFRRGGVFVPKKYRNSVYQHTIQKINEVYENGDAALQSERRRVED